MGQESAQVEINVSPEDFFRIITDYEKYPQHLSTVKEARVVRRKEGEVDVAFGIEVLKPVEYVLRMVEKPPTHLSWSLVKGDLFKVNSGSWELKHLDGGKATRALYTVEVDLALFVPKMITRKLISLTLPKNLAEFKAWAEKAREI